MSQNLSGKFNLAAEMDEALYNRDLTALADLIQRGADVNQTDNNDNTPLILAAIKGDTALAQLLIDRHADLERINWKGGHNALMLAAFNEPAPVVRLLIDAGADLDRTARDFDDEVTYGAGPC